MSYSVQQIAPPSNTGEEKPQRNIIVAHASVGSGHKSAAEAIGKAFEILRDNPPQNENEIITDYENLNVEVLDMLDFGRVKFDGDATASMFTGVTRPIYDLTWRYFLTGRILWGGGTAWTRIMFPKFVDYVREKEPLAIICTHITAANVAVGARMITGLNFPIVCVPTDYEVEGFWPHKSCDLFCVANEYMAETLRPRKVPEGRIYITGLPTQPSFSMTYDRVAERMKLGLPVDKPLVLILAGAQLKRPYIHFREAIDELFPFLYTFENAHIAILAGNDREYYSHLKQQIETYRLNNVTIFDYVNDMAPLMAASDLVICKSGGLTVTECLCVQTPMIIMGRAYGQEKANMRMLTSAGAALHVTTPRELLLALHHVIDKPESMQAMLINASFLRRPDAAADIAKKTMELTALEPNNDAELRKKSFIRLYRGKKPAHIR